MPKKKTEKKIMILEPNFSDILVCQKNDKRPFIEIFTEIPENVTQQNLGVLAGILEITDDSEDSSYIVNYLVSVIKKEYFSNSKRGTIESFEAALHKANLALSKLAEHGNVNWIGHLNAVCLVCEKNNIHLSFTGQARSFLLRSKSLATICEGNPEEPASHPLKTFEDVLSGRLQENDKIIVTTEAIFDILSPEEIKRGAIKFSSPAFIQFLHTAVVNELERAAVLVIDIDQKQEAEAAQPAKKAKKLNAFSQKAFSARNESLAANPTRQDLNQSNKHNDPERKKNLETSSSLSFNVSDRKELVAELNKEFQHLQEEFVDEKTGHIYIKDDGQTIEPTLGQKFSDFIETKKTDWKKKFSNRDKRIVDLPAELQPNSNTPKKEPAAEPKTSSIIAKKLAVIKDITLSKLKKIPPAANAATFYAKAFLINRIYQPLKSSSQRIWTKSRSVQLNINPKEKLSRYQALPQKGRKVFQKAIDKAKNLSKNKIKSASNSDYANDPHMLYSTRKEKREWLDNLSSNIKEEMPALEESFEIIAKEEPEETISPEKKYVREVAGKNLSWPQTLVSTSRNIYSKAINTRKLVSFSYSQAGIFPSITRLKNILLKLPGSKKLYAGAAVILIFVIPYFIVKFQKSAEEKIEPQILGETKAPAIPLEQDKNVVSLGNLNEIYSGSQNSTLAAVNDKNFLIEKNQIIDLETKKAYDIPAEFNSPELTAEMDDLNLIFLIKNNAILSFSATAKKFQTNNVIMEENAGISAAASYLTYLYLVDGKNNQIYRYPRAEGGFGQAINWLKDEVNLSTAKNLAINEDVFLAMDNGIEKLSKGKKQPFSLENSATPITADKVYIKPEFNYIYILDKINARIIALDKEGRIVNQYHHSGLAEGTDFVVSEKDKKATVMLGGKVAEFDLN